MTYIFCSDGTQEGVIDFIYEVESITFIQENGHLSWHLSRSPLARFWGGSTGML